MAAGLHWILKTATLFQVLYSSIHGVYYRNNKSAWMTRLLFEEWIKTMDLKMQQQNQKICLTMDNFSAHEIAYEPMNIKLMYFEPNLTPFVQPLDTGIICCFKAHYCNAFCLWAITFDEAGEEYIYIYI